MSTLKVEEIQHPSNSNNAVSIASDSSVSLKHSGSAKLATTSTGVTITGACAATSFSGDGSSLTSLPAANLTGTLPALSAANLTSIPAANLTGTLPAISGANLTSLPAANLTGTLPAIDGSNLTNVGGGALELISATTVSSSASSVSITGLVQDAYYLVVARKIIFNTNSKIELGFLNSSGNYISTSGYISFYRSGASTLTGTTNLLNGYAGGDTTGYNFFIRLSTASNQNGGYFKGTSAGTQNWCDIHFQTGTTGIYGLFIQSQSGTINTGSTFLVYKFKES